jgi:hypothetical protein
MSFSAYLPHELQRIMVYFRNIRDRGIVFVWKKRMDGSQLLANIGSFTSTTQGPECPACKTIGALYILVLGQAHFNKAGDSAYSIAILYRTS